METALASARENGARVELLDLRTLDLPMYDPRAGHLPPNINEVRERVTDAHAYLVGSPVYHGSISGALKNFFDFLYPEVNGKLFGFILATGNDLGETALTHLTTISQHFHSWCLPYGAIAALEAFDEAGHLINRQIYDRLLRMGRDIAVYGEMLYDRFSRDTVEGGGPQLGFAPWHARE